MIRFAGAASSATGTRMTAAISAGSPGATGHRGMPPAEHRRDPEIAAPDIELGHHGKHPDAGRIDARLLRGLAQCRLHRAADPPRRSRRRGRRAGLGACAGQRTLVPAAGQARPAPSPNRMSTAAGRPPRAGGRSGGGTCICAAAAASLAQPGGHRGRIACRVSRQENGPALTSLRAVAAIGRSGRRTTGTARRSPQAPQAGLRAWQTRRPCQISRCDSIVHSDFGNERPDLLLDLVRVVLAGPAEPAGQPREMRVHRDAGYPERVAEHHVGRLAAHAGQRDQVGAADRAPRRRTARRAPGRAR